MCNAYEIGRRVSRNPLKNSLLLSASLDLPSEPRLIRRTDSAPVITAEEGLVNMRWGFERPSLRTINNSREDKLSGPMWAKTFRERRCVISASAFYEWSGNGNGVGKRGRGTNSVGETGSGNEFRIVSAELGVGEEWHGSKRVDRRIGVSPSGRWRGLR